MAGIATIAVPTKDRPESFKRALRSHMVNAKLHGRDVDFFVLDKSSTHQIRGQNKKAIRDLYDKYRLRVYYAVDREVDSFIARLSQRGVPRRLAFFALRGVPGLECPVGGTRNAAILHTLGDCFLSVDDDMVCEVAGTPGGQRTVRFLRSGGSLPYANDPTSVSFFSTKEESFSRTQFAWNQDVLALFEETLGLTSAGCMKLKWRQVRGYPTDGGVVRAVQAGTVGDAGIPSSLYFSVLGYSGVTRDVFRAPPEVVLSSTVFCASQPVAFDNRDGIPPCLPTSSNEHTLGGESLTGALMACSCPGSMVAHLPWAMRHDPPEERSYDKAVKYFGLEEVHLPQLISYVVGQLPAGTPLSEVGRRLLNEAESGLKHFTGFLGFVAQQRRQQLIPVIEKAASKAKDPSALNNALRAIERAKDKGRYSIPVEMQLGERYGLEAAADITRFATRQYGKLLMAWDDVLEAARQVRQSGYRLGAIP